jgi:hypothetical protein
MNYMDIANSGLMFALCLIPVTVIVIQAVTFMRMAYRKGVEIGMSKERLKQCIKTSATLSVVPALSLVTLLIALSVSIGKYFPWLRLSNIGAGGYEPMAAEVGMNATGAGSFSQLSPSGFMTVMLCMNLGMSVAPIVTLVSLKKYDKSLKNSSKNNPFIVIGTGAAFLAIIARLTMPYIVNFKNKLGIIATLTGAIVMIFCMKLGKKIKIFKEFSLSLSLIVGVLLCIILAALKIF